MYTDHQRSASDPRAYTTPDAGGERRDDPNQALYPGAEGYNYTQGYNNVIGGSYSGYGTVNNVSGYGNTTSPSAPSGSRRTSGKATTPPPSTPATNPSPRYYPNTAQPSEYQPSSAPPQVAHHQTPQVAHHSGPQSHQTSTSQIAHQQSQPQTAHPYGGGYYNYYDQTQQHQQQQGWPQYQHSFAQAQASPAQPARSSTTATPADRAPGTPYDYPSTASPYTNWSDRSQWQTPNTSRSQQWQGYAPPHLPPHHVAPGQYPWQQWNGQGYGYPTPQTAPSSTPAVPAKKYKKEKREKDLLEDYKGLGKRHMESGTEEEVEEKKDVRKKKGKKDEEKPLPKPPAKSHLHPPRQAQSAWQLFFNDELNKAKASVAAEASPGGTLHPAKLNVAQIAKDAGAAYANLDAIQKAHYAAKVQESKEQYAKDLSVWQATLTPEDIRLENAFRAQQRKDGKSRKGNLKDPNAPRKPLSAYFLFLKGIREDDALRARVWGEESETTKQSVLAAERWRNLNADEKKPFLQQAEEDKREYEGHRKLYESEAAARARGEDIPFRPVEQPKPSPPKPVIKDLFVNPLDVKPPLDDEPNFGEFTHDEEEHSEEEPSMEMDGFPDPLLGLASFHESPADHQQWDELQKLMGSMPEVKGEEDTSVAPALHEALFDHEETAFPDASVRDVAAAAKELFAIPEPAEPAVPSDPSGIPTEEINELLPSIEEFSPSRGGETASDETSSDVSASKSPEPPADAGEAAALGEEPVVGTGSDSSISSGGTDSLAANEAGTDGGMVTDVAAHIARPFAAARSHQLQPLFLLQGAPGADDPGNMFSLTMDEDSTPGPSAQELTFPVLSRSDLDRVATTILHLFDPRTSSDPLRAKHLHSELQSVQQSPEAWGLIAGLSGHEDANVRFFGAHTAQVKISRDWETIPRELHSAFLALLLDIIGLAISPANPYSYQPGNAVVVRKIFGSLASLLLRLPFHLFPHPLVTVLQAIAAGAAVSTPLPPSAPGSGYSTPGVAFAGFGNAPNEGNTASRTRLYGLEWLAICVEEIGRAGISEQKRNALTRHLDMDLPVVMETIKGSMEFRGDDLKEAEAACRCAESWIGYGLGGDELIGVLPSLYGLLPLPAASSAIGEALSESIFKFGKGTKVLTEPLMAWIVGSFGQAVLQPTAGETSEELVAFTKLIAALIEHSSEWLIGRLAQTDVQALLQTVLRLTSWEGLGSAEEDISELTLPVYPMLQEALMDAEVFQAPHDTDPNWAIAKSFFSELVNVTRRKVRWPDHYAKLDREKKDSFDGWRRDAGEVIVCAYYVLRDEMLKGLTEEVLGQIHQNAPWQDIEATLHCIRYSSEAVPLGEETSLPVIFGDQVLGRLADRPLQGREEACLRLTVVSTIQSYEEWFKFHADHLLPVLSYLVASLSTTPAISRSAADALKALCDLCRNKLVQHIGAFSELHGKIGDLGPDEQTKVIQAITSVIQALPPVDAIDPVIGILKPVVVRMEAAVAAATTNPEEAQPILVQTMNAITASFKGLSPSDEDIFDLVDETEGTDKDEAVKAIREDLLMQQLRASIEQAIAGVVQVWNGDAEVADSISSLVKHSTLSSSETLISLSPLALLSLVCAACERSPSALWMSLASTLVLRINSPPSFLTKKKNKASEEESSHQQEETERWTVVADAADRLVNIAAPILGGPDGLRDQPDVVEGWFKFCSAVSSRFPGVLLRLPPHLVETYIKLGILGLSAQERFSLKTATEFFIALLSTTRFPSPVESLASELISHFGPQILRAILLSAGSEGPRSVIPNLAELLASFAQRVNGQDMAGWLDAVLFEDGFPDHRATLAAKSRLKEVVLRSRTTKKMREALHEFALVSRGLDNTTYGNATAI